MPPSLGARSGVGPDGPTPGSLADASAEADPESVARALVLRRLTTSAATRAQLAALLARRGVPDEVAERVLNRFGEVDLIDDAAYARAWVESRHSGRGLARRALAYELRQRGVADADAADALEAVDPERELAAARELVRRRLPATEGLDPAARTRRLAGLLARKGYSGGLAMRVVREALAASDED